jgi:hypothetical protein
MREQIIRFEPTEEFVPTLIQYPKSSSRFIPNWYKKDPTYTTGKGDILSMMKNGGNGTYKACTPVTDSITSGYTIVLSAAVSVRSASDSEYLPEIFWNVHWGPLERKPQELLSNYPVPHNHSPLFFRWITYWGIRTPSGYSSLITHPHHRYDLPFTTISGVVDTDRHPNSLELPFFIKNDFEGIIEEGTPIAQILPFKRDNWKSEPLDFDPKYKFNSLSATKLDFIRTYKNRYWTRKNYL